MKRSICSRSSANFRIRDARLFTFPIRWEEILKIADEVTIARDGQYVGTWDASGLTTDLIINPDGGTGYDEPFPAKRIPAIR